MSFVEVHVGKVGIISLLLSLDSLNGFFKLSASNLRVIVFWYILRVDSLSGVIVLNVSLLDPLIIMLESEVPGGLINFLIEGFQGLLFSSFNPIKFILKVSSDIPKVF